jgi:hypothetical protein
LDQPEYWTSGKARTEGRYHRSLADEEATQKSKETGTKRQDREAYFLTRAPDVVLDFEDVFDEVVGATARRHDFRAFKPNEFA